MKRFLCLSISVLFVFSVFSACSKESDNTLDAENIKITIDSHYDDYDPSVIRAYEKLCRAVINGEDEVKYNTSLSESVNQLFYTCFPLYSLVDTLNPLEDMSGISIKYKNELEEHKALVSSFYQRVEEIKAKCGYGNVNTNRYIFNVYTYITKNFTVDNSVLTTFDTLINSKGYPASICSVFEFLVLQGDGKAGHILNYTGTSNIMSFAEFKGKIYFFNPALDIENNQGKALTGFAMNSKRVGDITFTYTDEKEVEAVTDNSLDKLENSISYAVDGNNIKVNCSNNDSFLLKFN